MKNKLFKNKKRLFSMALAVLMIFSMMPFGQLKINDVKAASLNYDLKKFIPLTLNVEDQLLSREDDYKKQYSVTAQIVNNNGYAAFVNSDVFGIYSVTFIPGDGWGGEGEEKTDSETKRYFGISELLYGTDTVVKKQTCEMTRKAPNRLISESFSFSQELSVTNPINIGYLNISKPIEYNGEKTYEFSDGKVTIDNSYTSVPVEKKDVLVTTHIPKSGTTEAPTQKNYLYGFSIPKTMTYFVSPYSEVEVQPIINKILKSFGETDVPEFIAEDKTVSVTDQPVVVKCTSQYIIGEDLSKETSTPIKSHEGVIELVLMPNQSAPGGSDFDSSELEAKIAELEKQIKGLTETIDKQKTDLENLKKQIPETEDEIKALQDAKAALENKISENEDLIKSLKEQLNAIAKKDAEQDEIIKDLTNKLDELTKKNEALEKELAKAKEEELAKAKEDAKKEIDKLENLSEEDKNKAKSDIDNAPDKTTVDKIVEDAKKKDADNKAASDEKTKEELAKAKEEAKAEIDKLPGLTNTDKDKYAKEIDNAKTVKEVKDIIDEAKKKSDAKLNENDPEYLKNKLKGLIEEAKRVRYPSEELEEAIDEAYDILLDRYSKVEDYKYAIENLERILQNMRDTRRNRFKLDVDDLNEKDEELTGKTETKWYIDVYNGKKRILSGQANYKGDFAIEIKKGKIKAKDTLKVVATDPQNDKKYKEVEIEVGGDSKETKDNKPTFNINDLLQADGSKPLTDLAVFPVGKNFYNVVQNGQKTTVYMDVKTFISGNRTMLPIRYIAYTLGFNVEYDNFTREAIFSNTENSALAKKTIRVNIDTGLMKDSYGNVFASDVRPVLINNRIHASIANIARMFEASQGTIEDGVSQTIEWDSARKAVYVFKNVK